MKWLSMISYSFSLSLLQEKLKRLIRYLNFKDIKNKSQKQTSQDDDEVLEASGKGNVILCL